VCVIEKSTKKILKLGVIDFVCSNGKSGDYSNLHLLMLYMIYQSSILLSDIRI
jgi:hypothetical protein